MNDFAHLARPTKVAWQGEGHGMVQFGEDSRLVVLFYTRSVLNTPKSQAANTPMYDNITHVRIHEPGERLNIVDRPANASDQMRFPIQWNRFLQNQEQVPEGTPIDLLFPNNPACADMLKGYGVYTIQQCANISANGLDNIGMGAQDWKNLANKYLESATDSKAFNTLQQELTKEKQANAMLTQRFDQLKSQFDALMQRLTDPNKASNSPSWIEGHDAQAERINATHISSDPVVAGKKGRKPAKEVTVG